MKSIYQYLGILSMLLCCLGFGACTDEVEYSPAELPAHVQAYFPNNLATQVDMDRHGNSFTIEVSRMDTKTETTVELTSVDKSGKFTIPTTATFKAGESVAPIVITYNYSEEAFPFEEYFPITISLAGKEYNTPYVSTSYSFKAGIPAPYKKIGTAMFQDNALFGVACEVNFLQNELPGKENYYRLENPYALSAKKMGEKLAYEPDPYLQFFIAKKGDVINGQTLSKDDLVFFSQCNTGVDMGLGGATYIDHPSALTLGQTENTWLYNKVLHRNEDGSLAALQLAPIYWNPDARQGFTQYFQMDGVIVITIGDYVIRDYALEVECTSIRTDMMGNTSVIGNIAFGSDIAYVKATVATEADAENAANGLISGEIQSEKILESGEIELPFDMEGKLALVVVGFDEYNVPQGAKAASFTYSASGEKYPDLVKGTAIDKYVGSYKVPAKSGQQSGYMLATIAKKDEHTLALKGLYPGIEGLDDTVELSYDAETGLLEFAGAMFPDHELEPGVEVKNAMIAPINSTTDELTETDALMVGFTEKGTLLFVNKKGNQIANDAICVLGEIPAEGKGLYTLSPIYFLEWSPYTQSTRSLFSMPSFGKSPRMQIKKVPTTFSLNIFSSSKKTETVQLRSNFK